MIDLKIYGAFIENTIRPLIEESESMLSKFAMFNFTSSDIKSFLKRLAVIHVCDSLIEAIKTITCTAIIGYVAWTISR